MFWIKCGKLLTNENGNPINCDFCPCGGYAVFAFVERGISSPDAEPDPCAGQYATVRPVEIKSGHICYGDPYGWGGSIDFALHPPDSERKVGYYKGCTWEDQECVQYDEETWDCLQWETFYSDCKEIKVYQLTPCFERFEDFRQAFFDPCDSSYNPGEGETPEYPLIWDGEYLTSEADQCIESYWQKFGNALCVKNNIEIQSYGMSYNATAWGEECTETSSYVETDPQTGEVIWEWEDCLNYVWLLFSMYNTTWGDNYSVAVPEQATEEELNALWQEALDYCNASIQDAWENYQSWPYTTSTTSDKCINQSITGGGSCYGGYGCHSFSWDGAGYKLFKFREPSDVETLRYCEVGKPVGVQIIFNNETLNVRWNNYAKTASQTASANLITEPYYLSTGSCYDELNTECPGPTNTVTYNIKSIKYIWS